MDGYVARMGQLRLKKMPLERPSVDGRTRQWCVKVQTGLIWLNTG